MPNDVEIASLALLELGSDPFGSFEEAEERDDVRAVSLKYPIRRDQLLASYPWSFSTRFAKLTREAQSPIMQWEYSFLLPSDRLPGVSFKLYDDDAEETVEFKQYEVQQNKVLANEADLWIAYTIQAPEGLWPSWFVMLMVKALAADCAVSVTDQTTLRDSLQAEAFGTPGEGGLGGLYGDAMSLDAQQSPEENWTSWPFVAVRH